MAETVGHSGPVYLNRDSHDVPLCTLEQSMEPPMKPDNFLRALQHFGSEKKSERKPQQESDMAKQRGQDQVTQAKKMEALRTLRLARDAELANDPAPVKTRKTKVGA
jgi:hypothetical protein